MTLITVVSAGLREPSSTKLLADRIAATIKREIDGHVDEGVEVRQVELRRHAHAIADALLTGFPSGDLATALADVSAADVLVLVTPTFQATFSGLFKSFMDLVEPDRIRGTVTLLAATGGTERHSLVIDHALRPLAAYLGLVVAPTGVYAATQDFGGAGSASLTHRIDRAAREVALLVGNGQPLPRTGDPRGGADRIGSAAEVTPFADLLAAVGQ